MKANLAAAATVAIAGAASAAPRTERVTFDSHGDQIVGTLYVPEGVDAQKRRPALLVTGAWMTVKEQMPALYAKEMADRGFVALIFDFRGWGESGGERRQYEDPNAKIADIEAAVAYLATRPEADPARIGGFGICASSGYMVTAASETPAIKSVALVAPWLQDAEIVDEIYKGPEGVSALEAKGDAAEAEYRRHYVQSAILHRSGSWHDPGVAERSRLGFLAWLAELLFHWRRRSPEATLFDGRERSGRRSARRAQVLRAPQGAKGRTLAG
jgi:dienelactone hydrolase